MRLSISSQGHGVGTKILFALIPASSREPVLDVIKLAKYRPNFYGGQDLSQKAMRGPSVWSIGDRELMAAFVAKNNDCEWCTSAHTAGAEKAYGEQEIVSAASPIWKRPR